MYARLLLNIGAQIRTQIYRTSSLLMTLSDFLNVEWRVDYWLLVNNTKYSITTLGQNYLRLCYLFLYEVMESCWNIVTVVSEMSK